MTSGQIEMDALGRPFALGMLYDACNDELDTGFTLWDKETICKNKSHETKKNCDFGLVTSDTTDSGSSLVDMSESLKVSVMCGLVDIKQSVKFLIDMNKTKNQKRIYLRYKSTTTMEQLPLNIDPAKSPSVHEFIKKTQATHVVTAILKGANAFFVFDGEKTDENRFQSIEGIISTEIKKFQSLDAGGEAGFKLSENIKAITEKLSCKFHGDFILNTNPATFEEAIKTYAELPKRLGENGENAVPVRVWLTPLKKLNSSAAEMKRDISNGLLRRITIALESLTELKMRCDEALDDEVVKKIPQTEKKLKHFRNLCGEYKANLQKHMKEKIPLIRRGEDEEASVKNYLDDQEKSPFRQKNLEKWMENAEKEISAINDCVNILKKIKSIEIVQKETELKNKALCAPKKNSLCFIFTSVISDDPYLDQMDNYLIYGKTPDQVTPPSEDQWFHLRNVCDMMEKIARKMSKSPKWIFSHTYNYFIAALPDIKFRGATVHHYKKGKLKTDDFYGLSQQT